MAKLSRVARWPLLVRQIAGHGMMPVLPPGTYVFGWRWYVRLKPGSIVVFIHNGKEKIKRIEKIQNNTMYVVGDHPETSTDSRQFGWLPLDSVRAKVIWPHAPKTRAEGVAES